MKGSPSTIGTIGIAAAAVGITALIVYMIDSNSSKTATTQTVYHPVTGLPVTVPYNPYNPYTNPPVNPGNPNEPTVDDYVNAANTVSDIFHSWFD